MTVSLVLASVTRMGTPDGMTVGAPSSTPLLNWLSSLANDTAYCLVLNCGHMYEAIAGRLLLWWGAKLDFFRVFLCVFVQANDKSESRSN